MTGITQGVRFGTPCAANPQLNGIHRFQALCQLSPDKPSDSDGRPRLEKRAEGWWQNHPTQNMLCGCLLPWPLSMRFHPYKIFQLVNMFLCLMFFPLLVYYTGHFVYFLQVT